MKPTLIRAALFGPLLGTGASAAVLADPQTGQPTDIFGINGDLDLACAQHLVLRRRGPQTA